MSRSHYFRCSLALMLLLIAATYDASAKDEQWDSKLIPQGVTLTGKRADFQVITHVAGDEKGLLERVIGQGKIADVYLGGLSGAE